MIRAGRVVPDFESGGVGERAGERGEGDPGAAHAVEIESGIGREGECANDFSHAAADGECAAVEVDRGRVVHGVARTHEERAAIYIDDCAVAEGVGGVGLECAGIDGGGAGEGIRSGEGHRAASSLAERAGAAHGACVGAGGGLIKDDSSVVGDRALEAGGRAFECARGHRGAGAVGVRASECHGAASSLGERADAAHVA